ncbi:MAG: hypothetical protein Fur006_44180 [Coleofasciculaceae cyanobacterium]
MSGKTKQPDEHTKLVRKLVVPPEPQVESDEGDRSPTKTERQLTTEVLAEADAATSGKVEAIGKLVVPEQQSDSEEGDRNYLPNTYLSHP